mgnify:CR=1 FL=1
MGWGGGGGGFVFQAEDGIRDLVRSRGLGDVYKRQRVSRRRWPASVGPERSGRATRCRDRRAAAAGPERGLSLIHI